MKISNIRNWVGVLAISVFLFPAWGHAKLKVGDSFPEFNLKRLGRSGNVSSKTFKGKVVVIDFWASWCEPCKIELPGLNSLYGKYKDKGVEMIAINVDDEETKAKEFIAEHRILIPSLFDQGKALVQRLGIASMPSSFVLDKTGKVRFIHSGFVDGDLNKFEKEIKSLL